MVSGRPLLYMSLPGVVFILGVFWYRRRNKSRSMEDTTVEEPENINMKITKESSTPHAGVNYMLSKSEPLQSDSMNINNKNIDEESPTGRLFGKSAPIKIVQNSRGSPVKQQVDSEVLKSKIQNAEDKVLRSIDEDFENLSSPIDLPDSIDNRITFYSRNVNCKNDAPVVVRATRTPKISPENSFLESKYIKDCEENNNSEPMTKTTTEKIDVNQKEEAKISENHIIIENSFNKQNAIEVIDQGNTVLENEERNVDAASPSLSSCSDQSGDSGKGSSLPRSEANRAKTKYEFFIPNSFVGQLYGRKHTFINHIKVKTSADVDVRKTYYGGIVVCICRIEGSDSEIKAALAMIRQRLPIKRYPNFTMQKIIFAPPETVVPLSIENIQNLQLKLIEGINNDVRVSTIINAGHMFVQQPLHPTAPKLDVLNKCISDSYETMVTPPLPRVELNAICVMPANGLWLRVQIVDQHDDGKHCLVKLLDCGGYVTAEFSQLRQIRSDFLTVPFQATECVLSNVEPIDSIWSQEAAEVLGYLTGGIILQAQIAGYNSLNIPEVYLFANLGPNNIIFINKELVARNLAKWVD
ncbi:A-kinase anchor protein 1, mitochondrial isoform X2 [Ceratitis capitata]|uniref:A-kinase anchor protein 1, mitochondrial n=3 Tax=Ceratitis capitata TaxID=7213 RepID=W8BXA0_CERCA|nr:A-kinase anchor protein 1, mitochondrial isoform X2 [Ceratitis capitata]XP_004520188.1 A-kinase anchor protein 1, mitochondrial isoform X2 [Ceratitis capitata]